MRTFRRVLLGMLAGGVLFGQGLTGIERQRRHH